MMPAAAWLAGLLVPPLCIVGLGRTAIPIERLRMVAVVAACFSCAMAALILVFPDLDRLRVAWPGVDHPLLGTDIFSLSRLSAPLVVLPGALWLVTVAVTPRGRLNRDGLARNALAALTTTCAFMTRSPLLLAVAWIVSNLLFLRALSPDEHGPVRRITALYLWTSTVLVLTGIGTMSLEPAHKHVGLGLILLAVLIRKGIFPFHAWIPSAFERGRLGPVLLFCAPQLGTYVAAVLVVPHAGSGMLRMAAILSLATAAYGAALSLVQHDARRATGYLFVSQSALVLAGIDCTTTEALAGSLVLWFSSALAFTGFARTVLALEARRGRLDLRTHHGGYEQMPLLAVGFLVLGMVCTGFPGTLGFVGEEMLIEGAVERFPALGFLVVVTSALTGLAVLRMYFSLFCGRRQLDVPLGLRRREAIVIGVLASLLVVSGMFPKPVVASRIRAAEAVLLNRDAQALTWGAAGSTHDRRSR